jgi:hypothetical protein
MTVITIECSPSHLPVLAEKKSFLSFSHLSSMREKVSDRYSVSCMCMRSRCVENERDFACGNEMRWLYTQQHDLGLDLV